MRTGYFWIQSTGTVISDHLFVQAKRQRWFRLGECLGKKIAVEEKVFKSGLIRV
jgi:hypothetical protein